METTREILMQEVGQHKVEAMIKRAQVATEKVQELWQNTKEKTYEIGDRIANEALKMRDRLS